MGHLSINTAPADDTFCPREYAELRATVQATLLCDPAAAVQTAVTTARMTKGENWTAEGRRLLREMGLTAYGTGPMVALSSATRSR